MMIKEHKERKLIENTFNTENNIFFIIVSDERVIVTCDL